MKAKPLNGNVLIKLIEKDTTNGGLIIVTEDDKKTEMGIVKATDSELVKVKDTVLFKMYSLTPVKVDLEELHFIKGDDLLAILI